MTKPMGGRQVKAAFRHYKRRCLCAIPVLVLSLAGCESAGPEDFDLRTAPVSLAVISGEGQADTIGAMLPVPITVELLTEGDAPEPIAGVSVSFVVVASGCGRPFAGNAITNAQGRASERWELGTKAGPCTMEARAVDVDGTPRVLASIASTIQPGAVDSATVDARPLTLFVGSTLDTAAIVRSGWDRARNPVVARLAVEASHGLTADAERYDTVTLTVGRVSAKKPITWLRDLRGQTWTIAAACSNPDPSNTRDSLTIAWTTDAITYPTPGSAVALVSGTRTAYMRDGPITYTDVRVEQAITQTPGQLSFGTGRILTGGPDEYAGTICSDRPSFGDFATPLRPSTMRAK